MGVVKTDSFLKIKMEEEKKVKTLKDVIEARQQSDAEILLLLVKIFERLEDLEKRIQSSTST